MLKSILTSFGLLLLLLSCHEVWAEQRLVAVILTKDHPRYQIIHEVFERELLAQNTSADIKVYVQTPNPDMMSLRNSARKAVAINADLIVAYGTMPTLAAQRESFTTPIIYADVYEPVEQGLIPSKDRAGKHTTGISGNGPTQTLLRFYQQTKGSGHIAVVYDPSDPTGSTQQALLKRNAKKWGLHFTYLAVDSRQDLVPQLDNLPINTGCVYLADGILMEEQAQPLLDHAKDLGIPVITQIPGLADLGALMVLEEDLLEQGRILADYVKRFLSGEPIRDLNPSHPKHIDFVVNLSTAKTLDIHVPFDVLSVTNRVVR